MPNHVHLLIDTSIQLTDEQDFFLSNILENYMQLHKIMQLIKGGSSFEINQVLNRKGRLWQKDSYDHYIRNEKEFENIIREVGKFK